MTAPTNEEWGTDPLDWSTEPAGPSLDDPMYQAELMVAVARRTVTKKRAAMRRATAQVGKAMTTAFAATDELEAATDILLYALSDLARARRAA